MKMAKPFKSLVRKMSPESRKRAEKLKNDLLTEASIRELREYMNRTQEMMAAEMGISQPAFSSIENGSDMLISTLRRVLEAMGGTLKVVAVLPDKKEIAIRQFRDLTAA
jgi:DNA-binding XRE family transcriptional regulator